MPIKGAMKKNKQLPIFFLVDISGSMRFDKIHAVNVAMKDVVAQLKNKLVREEQDVDFTVRVLTFGASGAGYRYGSMAKGVPLADYDWTDITDEECDGGTPMGECIDLVREVFEEGNYQEYLGKRLAAPFVLLISDGQPTSSMDMEEVIRRTHETKVGQKSVFVSIGISVEDNEVARNLLETFGTEGFAVGDGSRPEALADLITRVTLASIKVASKGVKASVPIEDLM